MSIKNVQLNCTGAPDDTIMKAKLGEISGIVEMNIDSGTHSIELRYDDSRVSAEQIEAHLDHPGYEMRR